jgi:predicted transcriptional regulator
MACPAQDITDTELEILKLLWREGPLTTKAITEELYPEGAPSHVATVQSLLSRLEEKSLVDRDRGSRPHVFRAAVAQEDVIGRRLRALADALCDGSLSPLLTHLVRGRKLSAREREEIRALLEEIEEGSKTGKKAQPRKEA